MGDGGDRVHGPTTFLQFGSDHLGQFRRIGHVCLVQDDHARPVGEMPETGICLQSRLIRGQLGLQRVDVRHRVSTGLESGAIDHMRKHRTAFEVTEELQPQTAAGRRSRNQPRNVRNGENI